MFQRIRQTTTYSFCKFAILGQCFLLHLCHFFTWNIKNKIWKYNVDFCFFRGDQTIAFFGMPQNVFRCVKWIKITDNSFYYYARSGMKILGSSYSLLNDSKESLCNFYWNENKRNTISRKFSYSYFLYEDIEVNANNARVKVEGVDPAVTSWSTASYCNPTSAPGPEEYHVLIKKGITEIRGEGERII